MNDKDNIRNAALSGLPLAVVDIATIDTGRCTITLRHDWEDEDGRVIYAIRDSMRREAAELARETGRTVEIYTLAGDQIDEVSP